MGIIGIERYLDSHWDTSLRINIRKLVEEDGRKVIVVDGNSFYYFYVSRHIRWICGALVEFAENIREFVKAFEEMGTRLVFVFSDLEKINSRDTWIQRHNLHLICSREILMAIQRSQRPVTYFELTRADKSYPPNDTLYWVMGVLREMNCEVICVDERIRYIANYARVQNCLAIMAQNSYYVFYEDLTSHVLSLKHFDFPSMETRLYCGNALARNLGISRRLFPLLATLLGDNLELKDHFRMGVRTEIERRVDCFNVTGSLCDVVAVYIRNNYSEKELEHIPDTLQWHFPRFWKILTAHYFAYQEQFNFIERNSENIVSISRSNLWEDIKVESNEQYKYGRLCGKVKILIDKQLYEQSIAVQDFLELPPLGQIYKALRMRMYAILFYESNYYFDSIKVEEWCSDASGCPTIPSFVSPAPFNPSFHPGLLKLWDLFERDEGLMEMKWMLFAAAASPTLDFRLLRDLDPRLVLPTAVMYYLYHEVPLHFPDYFGIPMTTWEVEVFIAVAATLLQRDIDFLRHMSIEPVNARALRLIALFMHGCHIMEMVLQICGHVVEQPYSFIWYYFDGKLFHYLYEKARMGYFLKRECTPFTYPEFERMRQIIFSYN